MKALAYIVSGGAEGATAHMTRYQPADAVIVAVPHPTLRAHLLAYHEIALMAARLHLPEPRLVQLPVANPPLATLELYRVLTPYDEIYALINAQPSIAIPAYTALLLHALQGAKITVSMATQDPQTPYTVMKLDPVAIITSKNLKQTKAKLAQLLLQEGKLTPTKAAQLLGISVTTAERHLKWMKTRQLAQQHPGNNYTPTPWLKLYHETTEKHKKKEKKTI